MKARLDCIPCQQRLVLKILRLSTEDRTLHESVLRDAIRHLANADWTRDPMSLAKQVCDMLTTATGNRDPYQELKIKSNDEVLRLYPGLQQMVQESSDPLLTACKLAIAGNIMDFGAMDHFDLQGTIRKVLRSDFTLNDYTQFTAALKGASSLLLFADNAGEIVLDKLLLETLIQAYPLKKVTVVVKELPILNDATMQDIEYIGLPELPNVEFRQTNRVSPGKGEWMPPEVAAWIDEHDVVISKGQANYETLSEYAGIYFLLIAKCPIIAEDTGTYHGALIFHHTTSGN